MKTVLNDPPLARKTSDPKYRPLEEIFGCDFVTFHTPLTKDGPDKTYHLADDVFFGKLKKGAFFFNTSRGSVMETAALKQTMEQKKLSGVVLDVWENEPNLDPWLLANVDLSTPHIAGYSFDGKVAGMIMIYNAVCEYFKCKPKHKIQDFLPEPGVTEIYLTQDDLLRNQEQVIHETIRQVYVINRDDFNTREILLQEPEKRGEFFDLLRKNYPQRREFQNTKVCLPDVSCQLAQKIAGIGFQVCQSK
jgi:erythronate-4-phosphate dehydrogenase